MDNINTGAITNELNKNIKDTIFIKNYISLIDLIKESPVLSESEKISLVNTFTNNENMDRDAYVLYQLLIKERDNNNNKIDNDFRDFILRD